MKKITFRKIACLIECGIRQTATTCLTKTIDKRSTNYRQTIDSESVSLVALIFIPSEFSFGYKQVEPSMAIVLVDVIPICDWLLTNLSNLC